MHWLIVNSAENFEVSRGRGFDQLGMKTRWKKAAAEVQPGDTVFWYVVGKKLIAGEFTVTSESFFDDQDNFWICSHAGEFYPWRFKTNPVVTPGPTDGLLVTDFIQDYEYARRWKPQNWTLAFQGNVHRLNEHDYKLIHDMLATTGKQGSPATS